MGSLAVQLDHHALAVTVDEASVRFVLADGREISAPLEWFPRLRGACLPRD